MMDKLRQPKVLIVGFIIVFALLGLSVLAKYTQNNGAEKQAKQISVNLRVPKVNAETLEISTIPSFDFVFTLEGEVLSVKPINLLNHGKEYVVNVEYKDENNQTLSASSGFLYEDPSPITKLLDGGNAPGDGFDLYANNRHSFYSLVITPGLSEDKVLKDSYDILRSYNIDPETVEFEVIYSRSAREDGIKDPFEPVPSSVN